MRIVSVIGHKNAGKTTLVVALAREFRRQGRRIATIKHASHPALVDHEGTDTFRHFTEGSSEKTLIASPTLRVLFERTPDDTDPEQLARRYLGGVDLVLVEGFRRAPLPKVEVFRAGCGKQPLFDPAAPAAAQWLAIVTDEPSLKASCRVLRFQDTMWLSVLGALVWEQAKAVAP